MAITLHQRSMPVTHGCSFYSLVKLRYKILPQKNLWKDNYNYHHGLMSLKLFKLFKLFKLKTACTKGIYSVEKYNSLNKFWLHRKTRRRNSMLNYDKQKFHPYRCKKWITYTLHQPFNAGNVFLSTASIFDEACDF